MRGPAGYAGLRSARRYCDCVAVARAAGQSLAGLGRALAETWGSAGRWPKLAALCVALNLVETGLVATLDPSASPDLAPQASAVAPFGVFGDLRWVSVYQYSWWALAGELAAMLAVRGAITALSIGLAWPEHLPSPAPAQLLKRGICATALTSVLLVPSVALLFGLAAVPVSWLYLAAVPLALLVALVMHPAAVSPDWWRRFASVRALGWVALSFAALSASSAAMSASPRLLWPVVAGLAGLFNAWSWFGVVHAVVDRRPARRKVPVAALQVLALAGVTVGGTVVGFNLARTSEAKTFVPLAEAPSTLDQGPAVLVVSGYGSHWDGQPEHPIPGGFFEEPFSYRGLGEDGAPLPYRAADTAKPLGQLDRMLLRQAASLHERTGEPIDVVAESEGALIAKTALLAKPNPWVSMLVMASPLESPGSVWYPTSGNDGWGVATSTAMQLIGDAFQSVAPISLSPDNPLLASLDRQAPLVSKAMACPMGEIRQFALLPLADATVTPATVRLPFPSVVLPAFHGGLLETPAGQRVVSEVLEDRPVNGDQLLDLAEKAISYAASAWQVPPLVASDYPRATAAEARAGCEEVARDLRMYMAS
jgi:hypothetical protein